MIQVTHPGTVGLLGAAWVWEEASQRWQWEGLNFQIPISEGQKPTSRKYYRADYCGITDSPFRPQHHINNLRGASGHWVLCLLPNSLCYCSCLLCPKCPVSTTGMAWSPFLAVTWKKPFRSYASYNSLFSSILQITTKRDATSSPRPKQDILGCKGWREAN